MLREVNSSVGVSALLSVVNTSWSSATPSSRGTIARCCQSLETQLEATRCKPAQTRWTPSSPSILVCLRGGDSQPVTGLAVAGGGTVCGTCICFSQGRGSFVVSGVRSYLFISGSGSPSHVSWPQGGEGLLEAAGCVCRLHFRKNPRVTPKVFHLSFVFL